MRFDRHDQLAGCHEDVDRKDIQRRRRIDQHIVVGGKIGGAEAVFELTLTLRNIDQFEFSRCQIRVARHQLDAIQGGRDDHLGDRKFGFE